MRTKHDYEQAAEASSSLADMCRYFNILALGSNFDTMKHALARYNINTSHFTNPVDLKENHGKKFNRNNKNLEILVNEYGYQCSNPLCNISEWQDLKITLQVDHIDGNNTNDSIDNLRLLCPNCHHETDTFCMVSSKREDLSSICACGNKKLRASNQCAKCIKNQHSKTTKIIKSTKYKKEELELAVKSSTSFRQVLQYLNKSGGGSQSIIKNAINHYEIDTSHFNGQAWNKGKSVIQNPKTKSAWKNKLIIERGHKCQTCNLTKWVSGNAVPLELEHVDGNNKNNVKDNLKLLCPNCHSQTKTWKRKKSSLKPN
jgi:hypothetical protein